MRLFYTTSQTEGSIQDKINLSIGGQRSGTALPNGRMNNLFSDITSYGANGDGKVYIGLILLNELEVTANDVEFWFTYPEGVLSKLKIAAVSLNDGSMERLYDNVSQPLVGEFVEAEGQLNAVTVGNIAAGEAIGIWIERELDKDTILALQTDGFYEVDESTEYKNRYKEKDIGTEDEITFSISYT